MGLVNRVVRKVTRRKANKAFSRRVGAPKLSVANAIKKSKASFDKTKADLAKRFKKRLNQVSNMRKKKIISAHEKKQASVKAANAPAKIKKKRGKVIKHVGIGLVGGGTIVGGHQYKKRKNLEREVYGE